MNVYFDEAIRLAVPDFKVYIVEADVINSDTSDDLWQELLDARAMIASRYAMDQVRHRPAIDATRSAYKLLGKEPNRYRPSAEALSRRCVRGLDFYRTTTVVDLINLVSLLSGHSIGGFDADRISGDSITLGVGHEGEPYEAIGRGMLNIASMPVFRDVVGGIGTPTSDNERTKLSPQTSHLLMTVNIYGPGDISDSETLSLFRRLLEQYASSSHIEVKLWSVAGDSGVLIDV